MTTLHYLSNPLRPNHFIVPGVPGAPPQLTMAFQRARLCLPRNTATRLIRASLALGLERKAREGGCGGLSRSSLWLPHLRLPVNDESAAVVKQGFEKLLDALAKLGKPSRLEDYEARVETVWAEGPCQLRAGSHACLGPHPASMHASCFGRDAGHVRAHDVRHLQTRPNMTRTCRRLYGSQGHALHV